MLFVRELVGELIAYRVQIPFMATKTVLVMFAVNKHTGRENLRLHLPCTQKGDTRYFPYI